MVSGELGAAATGKRQRDATSYVVMRRPKPMVIGRASQGDLDAEAYARFVGNWGNISAYLGERWEELASERTHLRLGDQIDAGTTVYTLSHVEELDRDSALHREIERVGVSCPDALFCGLDAANSVILQPVDFKVSLDTASFDQVEAERLLDLATRGGDHTVEAIWRAVHRAGGNEPPAGIDAREALLSALRMRQILPLDGLFVAPDSVFNRQHLRSRQNQERRRPLRMADVLLVSVSPEELLGGLPGAEEAALLMQVDHVRGDVPGSLTMAERYARLGAGLRGVILLLHTPLFGESSTIDAAAELRTLLSIHHSSMAVSIVLQREREARMALFRRRDALLRFPYRIATLAEALGTPPGPPQSAEQPWPTELLREGINRLHQVHKERVLDEGRRLLGQSQGEVAVLEQLERDTNRFKRAAHSDVQRWADESRSSLAPGG